MVFKMVGSAVGFRGWVAVGLRLGCCWVVVFTIACGKRWSRAELRSSLSSQGAWSSPDLAAMFCSSPAQVWPWCGRATPTVACSEAGPVKVECAMCTVPAGM